ncbi:MAG: Mycothiol acetyltransferase [Anaerolineae bacterium]|nr:Mycothiol acetyltransferase [Anaerolineae bacterium]
MEQLQPAHGLTATQLAEIRQLADTCNSFEGLTMKLNWSTLGNRPTNELNDFLYYIDGRLVGYLALYIFNSREAEVSAMTHPDLRRRGIFAQLLAAARAEVVRRGIPDLLFFCERKARAGTAALRAIGGVYEFSEYRMDLRHPGPVVPTPANLELRPARAEDIPLIAELDLLCFGIPPELTTARMQKEISDGSRKQGWIATIGGEPIGKIHAINSGNDIYIGAFAVLPQFRGRGYGKTILSRTVAGLVAQGRRNISLEVATDNENALGLYQTCGFETTTAFDYYRLSAAGN